MQTEEDPRKREGKAPGLVGGAACPRIGSDAAQMALAWGWPDEGPGLLGQAVHASLVPQHTAAMLDGGGVHRENWAAPSHSSMAGLGRGVAI